MEKTNYQIWYEKMFEYIVPGVIEQTGEKYETFKEKCDLYKDELPNLEDLPFNDVEKIEPLIIAWKNSVEYGKKLAQMNSEEFQEVLNDSSAQQQELLHIIRKIGLEEEC